MDITLLMNTARDDFPMVGLPDTFIFEPTIRSLNRQELKNFELVIVDALWSEKRKRWLEEHARFPVKYIDALPNRWLEHGMVGIATQKNKGLLYAEGELVVFVDDCVMFPLRDWTRKIWGWYEKGYWPMSLTYYFEGGKPKLLGESSRYVERFYGRDYDKEQNLRLIFKPGEVVRDSRARFVDDGGTLEAHGSWFYGGSSATLEALLKINGVDEAYDSAKGLEDVSVGVRLEQAGYGGKFILDKDLYHIENWHRGISERVLTYRGPTPKCNYALLQYNAGNPVANKQVLTRSDCDWIRENICPKCNNFGRCLGEEFRGKFYIESEGFEYWLSNQRVFDLRKERDKTTQS